MNVLGQQILAGRDAFEVAVDGTEHQKRAVVGLLDIDLDGHAVNAESGAMGAHAASIGDDLAGSKCRQNHAPSGNRRAA